MRISTFRRILALNSSPQRKEGLILPPHGTIEIDLIQQFNCHQYAGMLRYKDSDVKCGFSYRLLA